MSISEHNTDAYWGSIGPPGTCICCSTPKQCGAQKDRPNLIFGCINSEASQMLRDLMRTNLRCEPINY